MPAVKTTYDGSARMFRDMDISPSDETGLDSIMYVANRGLPWWREIGSADAGKFAVQELGELQTAEDALDLAGLGWKVRQVAMSYRHEGHHRKADRHIANVRDSDGALLGVVSPMYKVIQNDEAFAFADALVDSGDAKYETAGALYGGRKVILSMELAHLGVKVDGETLTDAEVRLYLLLLNSHDGSTPLTAMVTPVRWVCKNTLRLALGKHRGIYRIKHSGTTEGKLLAAREALGIAFEYVADFKRMAESLAVEKVVDSQVREIMDRLWPKTEAQIEKHRETTADLAFEAYHASETLDGIRGTKWGVLNAVAEFVDHELAVKSRVHDRQSVRAWDILQGGRAQVKEQALTLLQKV